MPLLLSNSEIYIRWYNLQLVAQELVHLCHLRRNAQVDGSVANLHDEAAFDIGIDLLSISE